jgi:hypothetical protein
MLNPCPRPPTLSPELWRQLQISRRGLQKSCNSSAKTLRKPCNNAAKALQKPCGNLAKPAKHSKTGAHATGFGSRDIFVQSSDARLHVSGLKR